MKKISCFLQADEDPSLVPQMGDSSTFSFNPQGPPGADGGAGAAVGGANEAAASAGGAALGDAAPFQFWWIKLIWTCHYKEFLQSETLSFIKIPRSFKKKEKIQQISKKGVILSKFEWFKSTIHANINT